MLHLVARALAVLRRRRVLVAASTIGILTFPAMATASPNSTIPNGYYATVSMGHVPSGEDVEFTLHRDSYLTGLTLICRPDAAAAKLIASSGETLIGNYPNPQRITLSNGKFFYSGAAYLTAAYGGAPKVGTARVTIRGSYVANGPSYHYLGTIGNKVTATLIFEGTASSTACVGLPASHLFRLYVTHSS